MIVHIDDDTAYMQELLQNPIDQGVGNSTVVDQNDTILNGIHVEDIQSKDKGVDENTVMSSEELGTR